MVEPLDYASVRPSHTVRLKAIAVRQQNLTIALTVAIVLHFFSLASLYLTAALFAVGIYLAVALYRLMNDIGIAPFWKAIGTAAMFVPLGQLVALIVVNYRACEILRAAGLHVGYFGVSQQELERLTDE